MALDRVFSTPTVTVDQDKYDNLIIISDRYKRMINEERENKKMEKMRSLKIMISQPMRGKTTEQIKQERAELVKQLEAEGHEVLQTVFDDFDKDASPIYYLAKSIEFLDKADAVVFMPGWKNARGCQIEHEIAIKYNKFIKELEEK